MTTTLDSESVTMTSDQRTPEWHVWRSKGLGSSDAAVIMGASPWKTRFQLWEEKTGRLKDTRMNPAMERGNALEPQARNLYCLEHDCDMEPMNFEHPIHPVLRASLDGYNRELKRVLEIKCPGKEAHASALQGVIPEYYLWQLVHQLSCADAEDAHYYSFDGEKGVTVPFKRDMKLEDQLIKAELDFWALVVSGTPPELVERDYKTLKDQESLALFAEYEKAKAEAEAAQERVESIKTRIVARADHPRIRCGNFQMIHVTRKGSVNYAVIPALKGLDLEPYRKASTTFVEIRPIKGAAKNGA